MYMVHIGNCLIYDLVDKQSYSNRYWSTNKNIEQIITM